MHAGIHTNTCRCSQRPHTWFQTVKQVGLPVSLLSLLPVVWELSRSSMRDGAWWDSTLSVCLSLALWVFNLSPLLVAVICFFPQSKWLKRHRATTSGPQEDVLTPPTISPPHSADSPSLCLSLTVSTTHSLGVGGCRRACCPRQLNKSRRQPVIKKIVKTQQWDWVELVFIDSFVSTEWELMKSRIQKICSQTLDEWIWENKKRICWVFRNQSKFHLVRSNTVYIYIYSNVYDHKTSTLTFDTHQKTYAAHTGTHTNTPAAPDTFPASPIPSHFHPISLHFLLILKSIAAPPELSVWNRVTQNRLFFWRKEFQTTTGAESPHVKLYNDGNKLMRSVWRHYLQWLRKGIKCELKAITELFLQRETWKIPKAGSICLLCGCNEVISGRWTSINPHPGL